MIILVLLTMTWGGQKKLNKKVKCVRNLLQVKRRVLELFCYNMSQYDVSFSYFLCLQYFPVIQGLLATSKVIIYRQCEHGVIKLIDKEFKIKYGPEAGTKIGPRRPEIFFAVAEIVHYLWLILF